MSGYDGGTPSTQFFLPDLRGHHILLRSDNVTVVAYINHQGGLRSHPLNKLAQYNLRSVRAVYVPGSLNQGADMLSQSGLTIMGILT